MIVALTLVAFVFNCCLVVLSEAASPATPLPTPWPRPSVGSELRRLEYRVITDHMNFQSRLDILNNTLRTQCQSTCDTSKSEIDSQLSSSKQSTLNTEDNTVILSTVELTKNDFLREKEILRNITDALDDNLRHSITEFEEMFSTLKTELQFNITSFQMQTEVTFDSFGTQIKDIRREFQADIEEMKTEIESKNNDWQCSDVKDRFEALAERTEARLGGLDEMIYDSLSNLEKRLGKIELTLATNETDGQNEHKPCCKENWTLFEGSCYSNVYSSQVSKIDADGNCMHMDAYLVEIGSEMENDFVYNKLPDYDTRIWLGLERERGETWTLINARKTATFLNWSEGEPNDEESHEDCVEMFGSNGKWNDLNCNKRRAYMCERPAH